MAGVVSILLPWAYPISATAQTPDNENASKKLKGLEEEIAASKRQREILELQSLRASRAADALSRQVIEAASRIQNAENNVSRLEQRTKDLAGLVDEKRTQLLSSNQNIVHLIAAIERLSNRPPVLALLKPDDAVTTARSSAVMSSLVPVIDESAQALKKDLAALASLQNQLSEERFALKNELETLNANQQSLSALLAERRREAEQAHERAEALERELTRFAREAKDLKDLVAKLEREAAKARQREASRPTLTKPRIPSGGGTLTSLKGKLPPPATGPIISGFGERDTTGTTKGIKIKTRQNAQIIAPFDGSVVFAGPFRDYGLLLIIDHGDGYHSLLAGFESLQSGAGDWVLMGEPIGIMPGTKVSGDLYLELRHNGRAINPVPWLQKDATQAR